VARFLLDHNVSRRLVGELHLLGHDAETARDPSVARSNTGVRQQAMLSMWPEVRHRFRWRLLSNTATSAHKSMPNFWEHA